MPWTTTRRTFLQGAALGVGAFVTNSPRDALGSTRASLIEEVGSACRRLAPLGWQQLLLDATLGSLDITASDLASELGKNLPQIDRNVAPEAVMPPETVEAVIRSEPPLCTRIPPETLAWFTHTVSPGATVTGPTTSPVRVRVQAGGTKAATVTDSLGALQALVAGLLLASPE